MDRQSKQRGGKNFFPRSDERSESSCNFFPSLSPPSSSSILTCDSGTRRSNRNWLHKKTFEGEERKRSIGKSIGVKKGGNVADRLLLPFHALFAARDSPRDALLWRLVPRGSRVGESQTVWRVNTRESHSLSLSLPFQFSATHSKKEGSFPLLF